MYERATDLNKFYFDSSAKFALKSQSLQHILKTLNSCIKSDNVIPTKTFLVKKKGEKDKEKKVKITASINASYYKFISIFIIMYALIIIYALTRGLPFLFIFYIITHDLPSV